MDNYKKYILRMGDNALILGQRLGEWCGHGPVLEEDIALTNIALDLIGQARMVYQKVGALENGARTEDDVAFLRDANEFYNVLLVEMENGDFAHTIARQFYFSAFQVPFLERLAGSSDEFLRDFAFKSIKEARYHLKHATQWVLRLGDGTSESHDRMQLAINTLWEYTGELFMTDDVDLEMASLTGIHLEDIHQMWLTHVRQTLEEATLDMPDESTWMQSGGKQGVHTEHLGYILTDMQWLQRAYPGAEW
ncbi:MAG: phenylacetate-CoA oxygenase subunit PaaC [Flavobacteriales bacterium]|nr:phenylacetate-CoA oxygenase subunit PaaC [Flavobacteriales bacterium]